MRAFVLCVAAACVLVAPAAGASPGKGKGGGGVLCVLHAKLSARSSETGSTSVAKGHALVKVRRDGTIWFKTQILNRAHETFFAAHIHKAPPGTAGPIVVPLFVPPTPATSARHIKQSGVATPNPGTTGAGLCADPGAYYVNYHSTAFPAGAIRGQLH